MKTDRTGRLGHGHGRECPAIAVTVNTPGRLCPLPAVVHSAAGSSATTTTTTTTTTATATAPTTTTTTTTTATATAKATPGPAFNAVSLPRGRPRKAAQTNNTNKQQSYDSQQQHSSPY